MNKLFLYNTLSRKKEEFKPIIDKEVGVYTCGPTVYNYAHIGNLRTYIFEDILKRVLLYDGYKVKHVMNITDVGHLTGDMDMGEDKLELEAKKEGKDAWQIAEFYTKAFNEDIEKLNILPPDEQPRAAADEYIQEQKKLIIILKDKGYTYETSDGIYFDTSKVEDYNKLSHLRLEELKEGARVEKNPEKKNPTDFALWKFSPKNEKRQMEWANPWGEGKGFPGWHIECSAISLKLLSEQLDIHCGGVDHINVHHTNEIAQSEAATGKKFFNFWLHGAFLNIAGGKKMAKSAENFLTLENAFIKQGINPLAFRFAALQTHYRKPMEYSEEAIESARNGLKKLYRQIQNIGNFNNVEPAIKSDSTVESYSWRPFKEEKFRSEINKDFRESFIKEINNDLNLPKSMAVLQELLKSNLSKEEKMATALDFDKVLGLDLEKGAYFSDPLADNHHLLRNLIDKRDKARLDKNWSESDRLRDEIEKLGFTVEDTKEGTRVIKK